MSYLAVCWTMATASHMRLTGRVFNSRPIQFHVPGNWENRKVVHSCAYMTKQYNLLDSAGGSLNEPPPLQMAEIFPPHFLTTFFSHNCVTYPQSHAFLVIFNKFISMGPFTPIFKAF